MDDNVIISSSQQTVGMNAANVSLLKLGTFGQTLLGIVVTSVVIAATVATVVLIGTGVGYQPPILQPDLATVYKPDSVTIFPLMNDKDPKGAVLKISKVTQPLYGKVSINTDQTSVKYQGNGFYSGQDIFYYTVSNDKLTAESYVNVTILNRVPECADFIFDVSRNSVDNKYDIFNIVQEGSQISDLDNDELFVQSVTQPETDGASTTFDNKTLSYTPAHGFYKNETIVYTVTDHDSTCNGTVTFVLQNDPPVALVDTYRLRKNLVHNLVLTANDYDINGDDFVISSLGYSVGNAILSGDKLSIDYWADSDTKPYFDSLEYQIQDTSNATGNSFVTIEVFNTAPFASDATISVVKNTHDNSVDLVFGDEDLLDILKVSIAQGPKYGNVQLVEKEENKRVLYAGETWFEVPLFMYTVLYTPNEGSDLDDSIQFKVTDSYDAAYATVSFTLTNTAPVAVADTAECSRNNAVEIDVVSNDFDVNGDDLELVLDAPLTSTNGGIITWVNSKVVKYTAPAGFTGEDTFQYKIRDVVQSSSKSLTATATVTVTVFNEAPVAVDDTATVVKKNTVSIAVLENDSDPNGDELRVTAVSAASAGSAVIQISADSKSVSFKASTTTGKITFTYDVSDDLGATATATVTVDVTNTAPVAADDSATTFWNRVVSVNALENDSDADGDAIQLSSFTQPSNGAVTYDVGSKSFSYKPSDGFVGSDSFTYKISDGVDTSLNSATVSITVTNTAPVTVADSGTVHWATNSPINVDVLANDSDNESDTLSIKSVSAAPHGTTSIVTLPSGKVVVGYVSTKPYVGADSFTYIVSDSNKESTGTVSISVTNTLPIPSDDSATVHWRNNKVSLNVLSNDKDANGDTLTIDSISAVSPLTAGTVAILSASAGTVQFTVDETPVLGDASFTYKIKDGAQVSTVSAKVTVKVTNQNKPTAAPINRSIHWRTLDEAVFTELSAYSSVTDLDGDTIVLTAGPSSFGTVSVFPTAGQPSTLRFQNPLKVKGSATFSYTLSDGANSATSSGTVTVVNAAPVAANIAFDLSPQFIDDGIDVDVLAQATDSDAEDSGKLTLLTGITGASGNTGVATVVNGAIHYQPEPDTLGTDVFTYTISDGLETATATLSITCKYLSVSASEKYYTHHWASVLSGVDLNITAKIDDSRTLTLTQRNDRMSDKNGEISVIAVDGIDYVRYKPASGFLGQDSFTAGFTDGSTDSVITVTITITNTLPTVTNKNYIAHWRTLVGAGVVYSVASDAVDIDSDSLSITDVVMIKGTGSVTFAGNLVTFKQPAVSNGLAYVGSGGEQFRFTITDGIQSVSANVDVAVTNTVPVPLAKSFNPHWSEYKNGKLYDVLAGATDANGDTVTLYSVGSPSTSAGTTQITISSGKARLVGVPSASLVGSSFTFLYVVSDGASLAQQTVTMNVKNEPPIAIVFDEDVHWSVKNLQIVVAAEPTDFDTVTIVANSITSNKGSVSGRISYSGYTINYNPSTSLGEEILSFKITDGIQTIDSTAVITVLNSAPVTKTFTSSKHWKIAGSFQFDILGDEGVTDADTEDTLTLVADLGGRSGSDSFQISGGSITITPGVVAAGSRTFTYYVTDGKATTTGSIIITTTNTVPTATSFTKTIARVFGQARYTIPVLTKLVDEDDGDSLSLLVQSGGQISGSTDVAVSIAEYFAGNVLVSFAISDGLAQSSSATLTVIFTNAQPVCSDASMTLMKGETKTVTVSCTDANGDPVTISGPLISGLTRNGAVYTFTAPSGAIPADPRSVSFTGADRTTSATAKLTIIVTSERPVASNYIWNIFARRDSNTHEIDFQAVSGANDPDGDELAYSLVSGSTKNTCTAAGVTVTLSGKNLIATRPYTVSTGSCLVTVKSTDLDKDYCESTVTIRLTTSGITAAGRNYLIDHKEGSYFALTESFIMANDADPLGGTLKFVEFYTDPNDVCPSSGFCASIRPSTPTAGSWSFSQASQECQTQRFRYRIRSVQDPSQVTTAIFDLRFQRCTCVKPIDIVFVLDASGSVTQKNYDLMKQFVGDIVANFDIGTSSETQTNVGIVVFGSTVTVPLQMSSNKAVVVKAIKDLAYPQGGTNLRGALLKAESMLKNNRGIQVPKMLITIFDGFPNFPVSCDACTKEPNFGSAAACNSYLQPSRDCNHCDYDGPMMSRPCSDVLAESHRINLQKPGHANGYWRVMSIGVGPYLTNPQAKQLVQDLSYDKDLSLSVDWNQLSAVVSTIQSQSCDLVDTSVAAQAVIEQKSTMYCGQIVGLGLTSGVSWFSTDPSTMRTVATSFNPNESRGNLFQITSCGAFGTQLQYGTSSSFSLWNLHTKQYVSAAGANLFANSNSDSLKFYWGKFLKSTLTVAPTFTRSYLRAGTGYVYSGSSNVYTSQSAYYSYGNTERTICDDCVFSQSVSYNEIAYRSGLTAANDFPVPITDVNMSAA